MQRCVWNEKDDKYEFIIQALSGSTCWSISILVLIDSRWRHILLDTKSGQMTNALS
jgi:hypothetical protein